MEFVSPFDQQAIRRVFVDAFLVRDITRLAGATQLAEFVKHAAEAPRLSADAQMLEAMRLLSKCPLILVEDGGSIVGYVSGTCLNQLAVRMWLFGLIGLLDRHFDVAIELCHPDGGWRNVITSKRLDAALQLQAERNRERQQAELLGCLQISDKIAILLADPRMAAGLGYNSRRHMKSAMKMLATLRNHLAHNQDIFPHCTEAALGMAQRLDDLLEGSRLNQALNRITPTPPA